MNGVGYVHAIRSGEASSYVEGGIGESTVKVIGEDALAIASQILFGIRLALSGIGFRKFARRDSLVAGDLEFAHQSTRAFVDQDMDGKMSFFPFIVVVDF